MSRRIKAGTTDVSVVIRIIDSTDGTPETGVVFNTSGIDLEYRREGAVSVDITEATLAALTTAHTDGGFLHIGNGYYRLDLPDAACATGATGVAIHGTVTGMVVIGEYIELVAYDPYDTVRLGLTALPAAAADAAGGLPISDAGGLDLDAQLVTKINDILTDTGTTLDGKLDTIDNFLDTEIAAIITTLGTPAGASVSADIAAIEAQTDDIGAAGAGLTAIPWNANWDAEVQSEVTDALNAYDPPTRAELTSDINSVIAYLDGWIIAKGTIGDTGNDTTHVHLEGLTFGNDEINNYLIAIKDVSEGEWHARYIEDWVAATDLATVATLPFTPANDTDLYVVLAFRQDVTGGAGLDAAGVRAALGFASASYDTDISGLNTKLDTIDNFLDTEVAAILAAVDTEIASIVTTLGTPAGASISADILTLDNLVDDLESRIGTPSNLGSGATVAANLADIEGFADDIPSLPTAAGIADAVWDEDATGHQTGGTFGQAIGDPAADTDTIYALVTTMEAKIIGTLASGTHNPQTGDAYAIVNSGTHGNAALKTLIDAVDNFVDTEVASIISTLGAPAGASIAADLVVIDNFVDDLEGRLTATRAGYLDNLSAGAVALEATAQSILTDTNELQTDWVNGGRLDLLIDAILTDTDSLDTTKITTARAAVLTDWIDGGRLDVILDARASQSSVDTIDDLLDTEVAAILAAVDTEIAAIQTTLGTLFTTNLTEAYRGAGEAGSVAELLYEITAHLGEASISGTTKTTKKLDGSTTAKTYTLNSSSAPTSITETT